MLPDILKKDLNIVFCGTAAGNRSAEVGAYYAGRGNKFWPILHKTGLTPELVPFDRQRDVLQYHIGLTDLVKGQSGMDHAIDFSGELRVQLLNLIHKWQPKIICFNGKRAASLVLNQPKPVFGEQRARIEDAIVFIAPSTSGAANSHWNEDCWHQLATLSRRIATVLLLLLSACKRSDSSRTAASAEVTRQSEAADTACRCRIVLHKVAALGDNDDAEALQPGTVLSRDAAGRYLVAVTKSQSSIGVFAPDGNPLASFGRQGRGPGELERIRYVRAAQGDSVVVMDRTNLVLFSPSGSPARWHALPNGIQAFRFALLPSGHVVVNNYFPTHPSMVLLDRNFAALREFGSTTPADSRNDSDAIQYHLVGLDSGRFAAVRQNYRYGVEIWDTTGTLVRRFDHTPAWYTPWTEADKLARNYQMAGFPAIGGVYATGQQLWIAARVPDPRWKQPQPATPASERGRETSNAAIPVDEYDRRYDTVIEVLDIATGRVLVSQRFDAFVPRFTEGGFLYSVREAPSLLLRLDVWRPEIVREP